MLGSKGGSVFRLRQYDNFRRCYLLEEPNGQTHQVFNIIRVVAKIIKNLLLRSDPFLNKKLKTSPQ